MELFSLPVADKTLLSPVTLQEIEQLANLREHAQQINATYLAECRKFMARLQAGAKIDPRVSAQDIFELMISG